MRILWVKADKLLPVQSGGNIRSYHILRRLAARQELTFLSYYSGDRDPDYERELEKQLPGAFERVGTRFGLHCPFPIENPIRGGPICVLSSSR